MPNFQVKSFAYIEFKYDDKDNTFELNFAPKFTESE